MFLTTDQFIEKYQADKMPYFKVYKGTAITEKHCMARLTEKPDDIEGTAALVEYGTNRLQQFFDMYEDGNVTIVCKSAPKNDSGNASNVRWGEAKNSTSMTRETVGSAGGHVSATRQMKDMLEMLALMKGIFGTNNDQQGQLLKLQLDMAEKQREADIKSLKREFAWTRKEEEYQAMLAGEEPGWGETLGKEVIGLIRPLAAQYFAGQMPAGTQQLPVVSGVGYPAQKAKAGPAPQQAQFNPMQNASFDLILHYVRQIALEVFPEFSVNEVMPALAFAAKMGKDDIRKNVIPIIEMQRHQAMAATAMTQGRAKNEEEE